MDAVKYSIIIPVYKNIESLPRLLEELERASAQLELLLEVVFVVDGSPDLSFNYLQDHLPRVSFSSQLISHSRNFGAFLAIRSGLVQARGEFFGVMAADLQEPISLMIDMFAQLSGDACDVTVGKRISREDPFLSRLSSECFWWLYRKLVVPEMPKGGVDVFGCNRIFRKHLLELEESRSSLVALIFWLGFRRKTVDYKRLRREEGKSAWTLRKKLAYLGDSICAFTDLPIRLLIYIGGFGLSVSAVLSLLVVAAKASGTIDVPGYAATILFTAFVGALNLLSTGFVGIYAWRAYENSKRRPLGILSRKMIFDHD